jgi:hypothetical protein
MTTDRCPSREIDGTHYTKRSRATTMARSCALPSPFGAADVLRDAASMKSFDLR